MLETIVGLLGIGFLFAYLFVNIIKTKNENGEDEGDYISSFLKLFFLGMCLVTVMSLSYLLLQGEEQQTVRLYDDTGAFVGKQILDINTTVATKGVMNIYLKTSIWAIVIFLLLFIPTFIYSIAKEFRKGIKGYA